MLPALLVPSAASPDEGVRESFELLMLLRVMFKADGVTVFIWPMISVSAGSTLGPEETRLAFTDQPWLKQEFISRAETMIKGMNAAGPGLPKLEFVRAALNYFASAVDAYWSTPGRRAGIAEKLSRLAGTKVYLKARKETTFEEEEALRPGESEIHDFAY